MKNFLGLDLDEDFVSAGETSAEFDGYVDTGSYMLNAAISGSIYGGMPNNKVLTFAGETTTGKSYLALDIAKNFLKENDKAAIIYFDTESFVNKDLLISRGIDWKRVILNEPLTVETFKHKCLKFIDKYMELSEDKRKEYKVLMILDSLGQLSSSKEMKDSLEGKETKDMTRAQAIKSAFRTIRGKLARAKIPMIVTNHTYDSMGLFPTKEISGGSGIKFTSDMIVLLGKAKDKDNATNEIKGNFIHVKMWKARLSKENKVVTLLLNYKDGLSKYYGLIPFAEKAGILKKVSTRYETLDGTRYYEAQVYANAEKIFTKDALDKIEKIVEKEFNYGTSEEETVDDEGDSVPAKD